MHQPPSLVCEHASGYIREASGNYIFDRQKRNAAAFDVRKNFRGRLANSCRWQLPAIIYPSALLELFVFKPDNRHGIYHARPGGADSRND